MARSARWAILGGVLAAVVGIASVVWPGNPKHEGSCGSPKLGAALSSDAVRWDQFGSGSDDFEIHPILDRTYRFMELGGCERGAVSNRDSPGRCSTCLASAIWVVTAPTKSAIQDVIDRELLVDLHYPATQVSERHWEEVIPDRFIETTATMFSWTSSGCRYVTVRWDLSDSDYADRNDRESRSAAFLDSLDGDGCTDQDST